MLEEQEQPSVPKFVIRNADGSIAVETTAAESEVEEASPPDTADEDEANEITVSLGEPDESDEKLQAPTWVKSIRKQNREMARELRDARKKINELSVQKEPVLGPKPTLETSDYDADKFEQALESWHEQKRKADEREAKKDADVKAADQKYQGKLAAYTQAKGALGASDFDDAEAIVVDLLDPVQQGIIVHGAKDAALLIYALGKNEAKTRELAAIKDPVEFAFAVARLEGQMKVTSKKPVTRPEERVSGDSRPSGTVDSALDRLRAEATKTGDYTKVLAYKRKKK